MGRGRLGGTKAKIRGQVGSNIYQIKRDASGALMQSVYAKPESREYTNTEAQAKARMVMGQIDRMFHALPDIIQEAYINTPSGTLSFQHFAKMNYEQLKNERDNKWDEIGDFDWRDKRDLTPPAGSWFLTDGEYHTISYDSLFVSKSTMNELSIKWNNIEESFTIKDLLSIMNLNITDQIWFFYYIKRGPSMVPSIESIKFRFNPAYQLSDKLSDIDLDSLWVALTPTSALWTFELDMQGVLECVIWDFDSDNDYVVANGCFLILNANNGSTLFSTAQFKWLISRAQDIYPMQSPAIAFPSWKNDIPPTPSRLPEEYQEVEWIQRMTGDNINIPKFFLLGKQKFIIDLELPAANNTFLMGFSTDTYRWIMYRRTEGGQLTLRINVRRSSTTNRGVDHVLSDISGKKHYEFTPLSRGYQSLLDSDLESISSFTWGNPATWRTMGLFGYDDLRSSYKLYSFKAINVDDDVLIHDLVPCYRKTDNVCGFYDLIDEVFSSPDDTTSEYIHGPLV